MKKVIILMGPLLFLMSFIFPKNKKIWLYGAWFGKKFSDNPKDLFEYANTVSKNNIQHFWVSKDYNLKTEIESKGYKCIYAYSIYGVFKQLQAKVYITCINSSDFIPFLITPRNYFVQLWHGSPIKNIGIDSRKTKFRKALDIIRFKTIDDYSLIVSPSAIFDKIYKTAFLKKQNRIFRGGYPRNEKLFLDNEKKSKIRAYFNVNKDEKLAAYLPTHRNEGKSENPFIPILKELTSQNSFLKSTKTKIVIKPHFYEKDSLKSINESTHVMIRYDFPFDLYEFLGATDILITDYSSVIFDYELINKKIIVFPFDIENYIKKDRGLYFDFNVIYNTVKNVQKVDSINDLCLCFTQESTQEKVDISDSKFNIPIGQYSRDIYYKLIKEIQIE